jgi:hypothetical protein
MRENQGDSWLLVIRSQTANLIPIPSFGHNLCFRCSNGSREPISNIYTFQDLSNYIRNASIHLFFTPKIALWRFRGPTLKMRVHLGVWGFIPSHSFALLGAWNVTLKLAPWPTPLQALALVASPRLGLRHISFVNFPIMLCMSYSQRKVTLVRFLLVCRSSYTFLWCCATHLWNSKPQSQIV